MKLVYFGFEGKNYCVHLIDCFVSCREGIDSSFFMIIDGQLVNQSPSRGEGQDGSNCGLHMFVCNSSVRRNNCSGYVCSVGWHMLTLGSLYFYLLSYMSNNTSF